ncbi:diguanylate cyclase [Pseudoalteromonas mariniglutinosa]|uniref:sensor domain-containing diguanylate cyclase n=1 Tax=Pseudoalteromonas mariniglutinosa TaxID=206042 RepID=UPI00384FA57C
MSKHNHKNTPRSKHASQLVPELVPELVDSLNHSKLGMFTEIFHSLPEGVLIINGQGTFEFANPMAAKLLADSQQALIGQNLLHYLYDTDRDKYMYTLLSWLDNKGENISLGPNEVKIIRGDNILLDADLAISSLPNNINLGENLFICILHDLTSHKEQYNKLKKLATTDHLTGLANRLTLDEKLKYFWQESIKSNQAISTILIDIDYFKLFNDRFGHVKGDKCLQKVADIIKQSLPSRDCLAARYGGEEFAIILPYCHKDTAGVIAKQIQYQINNMQFSDIGLPADFRISVSQGIACELNNQYRTCEALICAADTALYRAKSAGRNKISIST